METRKEQSCKDILLPFQNLCFFQGFTLPLNIMAEQLHLHLLLKVLFLIQTADSKNNDSLRMFLMERRGQDIKYYNIWLKQIQRTASLDNSQKSSLSLHCLKWQNVRVIFANKISKESFGLASLFMICEMNFTLIAAVVETTIIPGLYFQLVLCTAFTCALWTSAKNTLCIDQCPGSAEWCGGHFNSFQKDLHSEQESAKGRE